MVAPGLLCLLHLSFSGRACLQSVVSECGQLPPRHTELKYYLVIRHLSSLRAHLEHVKSIKAHALGQKQ